MTTEPKLSPCAWCGQMPTLLEGETCVAHPISDCVYISLGAMFVESWNLEHQAILAQRKADFFAGFKTAAEQSFSDKRGFAAGEYDENLKLEAFDLFEDYLAEEREK